MPVFDAIIKETIRVVFAILALRRNINDTIAVDGKKVNDPNYQILSVVNEFNPDFQGGIPGVFYT